MTDDNTKMKLVKDHVYTSSDFQKMVDELSKNECETKKFNKNTIVAKRYVGEKMSLYQFDNGNILKEQIINNDDNICLKRETILKPIDCGKKKTS